MYTTKRLMPVDITMQGSYPGKNPFFAQIQGAFTSDTGETMIVPGFYHGDGKWTVRFSAEQDGDWSFEITSDDIVLRGESTGKVIVSGEEAGVPHKLCVSGTRFVDGTGKPVFLLGHECNFLFGLVGSPGGHDKLEIFLENLKKGGFNQIQVNSYAHDTSWANGDTCENDYGPPPIEMWIDTPDGRQLNPQYFEEYDWMVKRLHENGIYANIYLRVYNKYVVWDAKYSQEDIAYYRHFAARYQAYSNVVWCISKEAYYETDREYFYQMITMVKEMDAYKRLVTIHDGLQYALDEKYRDTVDFLTLQQHGEWGNCSLYYVERTGKPVVIGESGQEQGPNGRLDTLCFKCFSPEEFCSNAYETVFGGAYFQYYSVYMAWDVIEYAYVPPGYRYFKQMQEFFSRFKLDQFRAVPELIPIGGSAHCLDDGESTLLIYIMPQENERHLCYNLRYIMMHPNDSGRRFVSYKQFGIYSGKITDYTPAQAENNSSEGYFVENNVTHRETLRQTVMLEGNHREPIVVIITYEKTK